ncbi:DNA-3-methyladenine glycosylase [Burkholderiales bacterium]|nr:DNA-3-methyladenine glycosylase [Burkholderiales bacterium]
MKPRWWDEAAAELARRDRVMRRLVRAYPGASLKRRNDAFTALARAITGQQISVKAADAIWRRLLATAAPEAASKAFPRLAPERVAALPPAALRAAGFSQRKAGYLADLAAHFASGRLDPRGWKRLDDEALIGALVEVRGIGRWTAEMFLMFHELRPDVLPVGDLGLRNAIAQHYRRGAAMTLDEIRAVAEAWRPWRSAATWYLWRSLDPLPIEY